MEMKKLPARDGMPELNYAVMYNQICDEVVLYSARYIYSKKNKEKVRNNEVQLDGIPFECSEPIDYQATWVEEHTYRCPKCKTVHRFEPRRLDSFDSCVSSLPHKCAACGAPLDNRPEIFVKPAGDFVPGRVMIIKSDKGITVKRNCIFVIPARNAKKWPYFNERIYTTAITFCKSGQCVMTQTCSLRDVPGRRIKGSTGTLRRFINSTYTNTYSVRSFFRELFTMYLSEQQKKEFLNVLSELFTEQTGVPFPDDHEEFRSLGLMNSVRGMPLDFYKSYSQVESIDLSAYRPLFRHLKKGNVNYMLRYLAKTGAGKAIRKLIVSNPMCFIPYKNLVSGGITNKDYLFRIMSDVPPEFLLQICRLDLENIKGFLQRYTNKEFEPFVTKLLCENGTSGHAMFFEVSRLMRIIMRNAGLTDVVDPRRIRPNAVELHDYLSEIRSVCNNPLIEFSYSEEEQSLCDEGYTLPQNNRELTRLGKEFSNCVGSYASEICDGRSLIVCKRTTDGKADVCIELELCGDKKVLRQSKQFGNRLMSKEQFDAVIAWCKSHKIKYSGCSDISLLTNRDGSFKDVNEGVYAYGEHF